MNLVSIMITLGSGIRIQNNVPKYIWYYSILGPMMMTELFSVSKEMILLWIQERYLKITVKIFTETNMKSILKHHPAAHV